MEGVMRGLRLGPKGQYLLMALMLAVAMARIFGGTASQAVPHVSGLHAAAPLAPAPTGG
jgi:hypothetical protein